MMIMQNKNCFLYKKNLITIALPKVFVGELEAENYLIASGLFIV